MKKKFLSVALGAALTLTTGCAMNNPVAGNVDNLEARPSYETIGLLAMGAAAGAGAGLVVERDNNASIALGAAAGLGAAAIIAALSEKSVKNDYPEELVLEPIEPFEEISLEQNVHVTIDKHGGQVTVKDVDLVEVYNLPAVLLFGFDKDIISEKGKAEIKKLAQELQDKMSSDQDYILRVNGYTDITGAKEYNLDLSMRRARTVYRLLIEYGMDKSRVSYKGYGVQDPIATNNTVKGREKNRRVTIQLIDNG